MADTPAQAPDVICRKVSVQCELHIVNSIASLRAGCMFRLFRTEPRGPCFASLHDVLQVQGYKHVHKATIEYHANTTMTIA